MTLKKVTRLMSIDPPSKEHTPKRPPVTRYHDEDNLLANCKAILDGIAEGMQVNDNTFHFKEQDWLQAENPGHLIINITWEPSLGCRS